MSILCLLLVFRDNALKLTLLLRCLHDESDFQNTQGIIFVVDSNDRERVSEAREERKSCVSSMVVLGGTRIEADCRTLVSFAQSDEC